MNRFQQAFLAIAGVLAFSLQRQPITVDYNGSPTLVNGLVTTGDEAPHFVCQQYEGDGSTEKQGGLQKLEVDDHTCNLILPEVKWQATEQNKSHTAGAGAAGGGEMKREGGGIGGAQRTEASAAGGTTGGRI